MRWLVEVSAIGKGDTQSFCVEAETWQRALQLVRTHRGEISPMSGFSIELLESGYRAVDPVARLRFVVKRTTEKTPLTPLESKPAPVGVAPAEAKPAEIVGPSQASPTSSSDGAKPAAVQAGATTAAAPRPTGSSPAAAALRTLPAVLANSTDLDTTVKTADPLDTTRADLDIATVEVLAVVPPANATNATTTNATNNAASPATAAPAIGTPLPGLPAFEVLSRREHPPTESLPLSYREYAFLVPPGTKEGVAVSLLLGQLEFVQAALQAAKTGKLVQLAVFDQRFEGKPSTPPLATLTWKDWRGDPTVHFPRRASAPASLPASSPPPAPEPPRAAPVKQTLVAPITTLDDTRALRPGASNADEVRITTPADLERTAERPRAMRGAPTLVGVPQLVVPSLAPSVSDPPVTLASPAAPAPRAPSVPPPAATPRAPSVPPPAAVPAPVAAPRAPSVPPPAAVLAPVAAPRAPSVPPPAAVLAPVAAPRAPSVPPPAAIPAPAPSSPDASPSAAATTPAPGVAEAPPPVLPRFTPGPGPVALGAPPVAAAQPAPLGVERAPNFTPLPGNVTVALPPSRPHAGRVSGDELIATLFEAMHDLHFLGDAIQGADFCLQLALGVIPSRAGYAHFFDLEKREFVLVRAKGDDTDDLVGKRHLEAEPLLSAAVRAKRAVLKDANEAHTSRYMALGGATSVVLAPVLVTGRPLAILELVNPSDGAPFTQDEANALNYIAEQFAEFLSSRGLVFDHGRARAHG